MKLSPTERLILINQYTILERVDPDSAISHRNARHVLERNYEMHIEHLGEWISEEPFTAKQSKWVFDVLDMHLAMQDAQGHFPSNSGVSPDDVTFLGFDGNYETQYLGYTRYIVNDEGRWPSLKGGDFNSHVPMIETYKRRLGEWNKSADRLHLSKDDIVRILAA